MTLVLLGGGGHASDVLSIVEALVDAGEPIGPIVIADDAWDRPDRFHGRIDIQRVDSIEAGAALGPFIAAVGYPGGRRLLSERAIGCGGQVAEPLVHPSADLGAGTILGAGAVVMGQTWLSPRVEIGAHAHVGYGVTVGHDTTIGDYTAVMPSASIGGDTTIAAEVVIGANATVLQGLTIGDGAVVGAAAAVVRDVPPGVTVVGVPARAVDRAPSP